MLFDLTGKIAIVTGGSSGIGETAAYALAVAGAAVIVCGRNMERTEKVATSLTERGYTCEAYGIDVSDSAAVDALTEYTVKKYGRLDILFSNAGIFSDKAIEQIMDGDWEKTMTTNVSSAFYCCRSALKYMKKQHYGKIIITSSIGGKMTHPFPGVDYTSSKGALLAFVRHLANQASQYGITVNAIAPGSIMTPLILHRTEEQHRTVAQKIPMRRIGDPQEVAGSVVYLASDCSDFITGEIMDINGGLYID